MKKQALNLFRTYRKKTEQGGAEKKWVLSEEDLGQANPIIGKILSVPKYRKIIDELKRKVQTATSGVVNFVIGKETMIADAILKAAFPPGSGIVYKGVDGYQIDCSDPTLFGNAGEAVHKLTAILKGNVRMINMDDLKVIRELLQDVPGALAVFEGGTAPAGAPASRAPAIVPRSPARPVAQPAAQPGQQAQVSDLENILNQIAVLLGFWEKIRDKIRAVDRIKDPKHYQYLSMVEKAHMDRIRSLQTQLVPYVDWLGQIDEYDGTGFMDFEYDMKRIATIVGPIMDPNALFDKLSKDQHIPIESMTEEVKMQALSTSIQRAKDELARVAESSTGDIKKSTEELLAFIKTGDLREAARTVMTSASVVRSKVQKLLRALKETNKVLILNNVDDGPLVVRRHEGAQEFVHAPIFANEFVNREARKQRAAVLVSREPVRFRFEGVEWVMLSELPVDDEEAEALIEYYRDMYQDLFRQAGKKITDVRIGASDLARVRLVLQGKSHEGSKGILNNAFAAAHDKEKGIVDGQVLWKKSVELSNKLVQDAAAGQSRSGERRGCYMMTPRKTMERFIRDPETEFGKLVDTNNRRMEKASRAYSRQDAARQELYEKDQKGNLDPATRIKLEKRISKFGEIAKSRLATMPHFLILYGPAGSGKSSYAEVFAEKTGFQFLEADFGSTRGSLVGETEQWSKALIDSWERMANVVIRLDEIDGQVVNSEQEARESYNAAVVKYLLNFLETKKDVLRDRNVFIIATTNNPHRIRAQLQNRARAVEVPTPTTKEGYLAWLQNAIPNIKAETGSGFIYAADPDDDSIVTAEDMWRETEKLMMSLESDYPKIAEALVPTGMNFRKLGFWLADAWDAHMRFLESSRDVMIFNNDKEHYTRENPSSIVKNKDGTTKIKRPLIEGFPFTTENLIKAATLTRLYHLDPRQGAMSQAERAAGEECMISDGISALESQLSKVYNQVGTEERGGQLPLPLMSEPEAEETLDLLRPAEPSTMASTDYYFEHLVKSGIVAARPGKQAKEVVAAAKLEKAPWVDPRTDSKVIGSFVWGTVMLAPIKMTHGAGQWVTVSDK